MFEPARKQVQAEAPRRGSAGLQAPRPTERRSREGHPAPVTKMNNGPLCGALFTLEGWDQERSLVQQNAPAFWTPEGRPKGVRIGPRGSLSVLSPLPENREPGPPPGFFVRQRLIGCLLYAGRPTLG